MFEFLKKYYKVKRKDKRPLQSAEDAAQGERMQTLLSEWSKERKEEEKQYSDYDQEKLFPWIDVMACWDKRPDKIYSWSMKWTPPINCPKCGKDWKELRWLDFRTGDIYRYMFASRTGLLSVCEDCKKQVQFYIGTMS